MNLDTKNVATWLILVIATLGAAIVVLSAVDVVTDPQMRLSFRDYIEAVGVAAGLLAVGRGLTSRTKT
jgi:hypothetical protein